jgi:hypothetical protein
LLPGIFAFGCLSGDNADQSGWTPVAKPGAVEDSVSRSPSRIENAKPHSLAVALPFQNSFCFGQDRKIRRQ